MLMAQRIQRIRHPGPPQGPPPLQRNLQEQAQPAFNPGPIRVIPRNAIPTRRNGITDENAIAVLAALNPGVPQNPDMITQKKEELNQERLMVKDFGKNGRSTGK